jgi:hypothetical protein
MKLGDMAAELIFDGAGQAQGLAFPVVVLAENLAALDGPLVRRPPAWVHQIVHPIAGPVFLLVPAPFLVWLFVLIKPQLSLLNLCQLEKKASPVPGFCF